MLDRIFFKDDEPLDPYAIARRASLYILALNFILFAAKALTSWLGHSFALLADALNNLTDVGTSLALYLALRLASKPPDAEHAYGHGRIETEIARILGVFVLATAGGIIVGGINNLSNPFVAPGLSVIIVASISIFIKEYMYRFQSQKARQISSRALQADAINHRTDVGATACVLFGTLIVKMGGERFAGADDIAAIVVGVIMAYAAARVVIGSTQDMLDAMPPPAIIDDIRRRVNAIPGILGTEKILGRKMGMFYNIDMHVEVDPLLTVREAHYLGHQAAEMLKGNMPEIGDVLVHVEPFLPEKEKADWNR